MLGEYQKTLRELREMGTQVRGRATHGLGQPPSWSIIVDIGSVATDEIMEYLKTNAFEASGRTGSKVTNYSKVFCSEPVLAYAKYLS